MGVFQESSDVAAREGGRVEGVMTVDREARPVIPVEPVLRAHPHEALPVLEKGVDGVLGQAVLDREVVEDHALRGHAIEPSQRFQTKRRAGALPGYGHHALSQPEQCHPAGAAHVEQVFWTGE